ncbi:Hexaprenyldihydroxybenzoate methyltransferase, mitochondrial [Actinomortierella ambigua]|nr:Hexaprenyldihydroxybenzoate methyltransferase, mitochondrial [Actinomortierella ambigua]
MASGKSAMPRLARAATFGRFGLERSQYSPIDTVNEDEIAKFAAMSDEWWAPHGPFKMLHLMNPPRIRYIRNRLEASGALKHNPLSEAAAAAVAAASATSSSSSSSSPSTNTTKYSTSRYPLQGLRILDVGCGGGLLSEALARLGAQVTGLDASNENVQMARIHAQKDPLLNGEDGPGSIQYLHSSAEKLVANGLQYDVVCSMEVIEHVDNPAGFLQCLGQLVRPGGDLLLSTISRTPFAYLTTIWTAEHLLRFVPVGTHHYEKYIRPEELEKGVRDLTGCVVLDVQGVGFNPLAGQWQLLPKPATSPFYDGHVSGAADDDAGLLGFVTRTLGLSEAANYFLAAKKPRSPTSTQASS